MNKSNLDRKGFTAVNLSALLSSPTDPNTVLRSQYHWGKSLQELKSSTWRQELVQRPWSKLLTGSSSWLAQSAFLQQSGAPAQRWCCPQWAEQSVTALQACLQPNLMVAIDHLRVPPLRWLYLWVAGIKLTQTPVIPKRWSLTDPSLTDRGSPLFGGDLYA